MIVRQLYLIQYLLLALTLSVLASSCFKESPIKVPLINTSGKVFVAQMGADYTKQIYFNLQSAQFVDSNIKFDYDLAFDCEPNNYHIWLNGAKLMLAVNTGKTDMSAVTLADTLGKVWHVEYGAGDPASCALQDWWSNSSYSSKQQVYILNMGLDINDSCIGYKKLQIGDMNGSSYQVTYCNMDGSDLHTVSVSKRSNRNRIVLAMANGGQVKDLEPDYDSWDLVFTQFSVYFPVEKLPYKVTGVLSNPTTYNLGGLKHRTEAYLMDSTTDYSKIVKANVDNNRFSPYQDAIGYTWKRYVNGEYTTLIKYNFILHSEDRYYKLHFLDFYNNAGTKGYPKFEYEELK
jgi:hypothetical protein